MGHNCNPVHSATFNTVLYLLLFVACAPTIQSACVCPAWHVYILNIEIYTDYPKGASPLWASWRSPLVSCKGVPGDRKSEGSRTTRVCTDEQELHKRHSFVGEQPHLCEARKPINFAM